MSALLEIGFDEAGGEIKSENLKNTSLNPMIKGEKKSGDYPILRYS